MFNTFNMGIGLVMAVEASEADAVVKAVEDFAASKDAGRNSTLKAYKIGYVSRSAEEADTQQKAVLFK